METPGIIDDRDLAIQYLGVWIPGGTIDEFDSTTHGTIQDGAEARLLFIGESIGVYGTIINSTRNVVSVYTLDNSKPVIFTAPHYPDIRHKQPFYQSPRLENGTHTLIVKATVDDTGFWLDYLNITGDVTIALPWNSTTASSTTSTPSASQTHDSPHTQTFKKFSPVGPIVGGVVGGVVGLTALALLFLYYHRRNPTRRINPFQLSTAIPPMEGLNLTIPSGQYATRGGTSRDKGPPPSTPPASGIGAPPAYYEIQRT